MAVGLGGGRVFRCVGRGIVPALFVAWLCAVGFGLRLMWGYENAPGTAGYPPVRSDSEAHPGLPLLVLAAHPHCPCTRASLDELAEIRAARQESLRVRVLFFKPAGHTDAWARTGLWRRAAALPGVEVVPDEGGQAARRMGAQTSGHAVLFDSAGRVLFSGGITDARGHAGESRGRRAILQSLAGAPAGPVRTPVFGCSLGNAVLTEGKGDSAWTSR